MIQATIFYAPMIISNVLLHTSTLSLMIDSQKRKDFKLWSHEVGTIKLKHLETFSTKYAFKKWLTWSSLFNMIHIYSRKAPNMKVIEDGHRFPKRPRAWNYHIWAKSFEELKLALQIWISGHFHDKFIM